MEAYIVKLYDKCTKNWITLSKKITLEEALSMYNTLTKNSTVNFSYKNGDYFKIFKINI